MQTHIDIDEAAGEFQVVRVQSEIIGRFTDPDLAYRFVQMMRGGESAAPTIDLPTEETNSECDTPVENDKGPDWEAAFQRIAAGEKVKHVAEDIGVSFAQLRGRWAPRKAEYMAVQQEPDAASLDNSEQPSTGSDAPKLSFSERAIEAHLNAVGYNDDWTAERDFLLVSKLIRGASARKVAFDLGKTRDEIRARWELLNTHIGDIDHQARLVRVLMLRARDKRDVS